MWPYNFDFRRAFRHNVMFLVLAAYAAVLVASNIYTMDPIGSMAELASRGNPGSTVMGTFNSINPRKPSVLCCPTPDFRENVWANDMNICC